MNAHWRHEEFCGWMHRNQFFTVSSLLHDFAACALRCSTCQDNGILCGLLFVRPCAISYPRRGLPASCAQSYFLG